MLESGGATSFPDALAAPAPFGQMVVMGYASGSPLALDAGQAERFGGTAEKPFDPCYHQACDTTGNVDPLVLGQITDALTEVLRRLPPPPSGR